MSSIQQSTRFLPFSNNLQRKQLSMQGGLPQSLSGSDTDVSTSNENLSKEERYVIRHTARQEPQGQENQQQSPSRSSSHKENIPNIQGNLLNRNSLKDSLNGSNRSSLKENLNGSNRNSLKDSVNGSNRNSLKDNLSNRTSIGSNRSSLDVSTSSYNTLIIHSATDDNAWTPSGRLSGMVREHGDMGFLYCDGGGKGHSNSPTMQSLSNLSHEDHLYEQPSSSGCQEITDIPDDYLSQSQVLKHLAKEVKVPPYAKLSSSGSEIDTRIRETERGKQKEDEFEDRPPPSYVSTLLSAKNQHRLLRPMEKFPLSRSQPDLSRIDKSDVDNYNTRTISPRPKTKGREEIDSRTVEVWPPSEMIQIVIQENSALKLELERCYSKVAKSQKLEQEIAKVHRVHEELAASCERREKLERAARLRLQNDCRRLTEVNRVLRDQIDLLSARTDNPPIVESMRKELTQRELLIGQLITQNKELAAAKERQEIELAAQRATLQEQRTHIDILDTALTNAQGNVVRLEEECRKKQVYVERVGQLQRALSSLQASSDRREETERQLRGQLERELREGSGTTGNEQCQNGDTIAELKRRLREKDEKIMSLEGDITKWEQRYLEESALRQAAIEAASLPKDAKIAALEKTSQDAEKLIAEARSEKMRHMDEVHAAQKKLADLESRMKDLESKLAERDAMIRVLQKHTYDKDSSSSSGVGSYPAAHSSHSSTSADHHTALTSTPELVSSVLGTSSSYGNASSYAVTESYKYRKQGSFEQTNKSLDDQLKELDSQLLSKRALCCFPGFSNPGSTSRKGKVSKPLLASVDSPGSSSTASSKSRLLDDSGVEVSGSLMEFTSPSIRLKNSEINSTKLKSANLGSARLKSSLDPRLKVSNLESTRMKSTNLEAGRLKDDNFESARLKESNVDSTRLKANELTSTRTTQRGKLTVSRLSEGKQEDMLLLEKQGKSSQRQRMQDGEPRRAGSLPPSSLPRPPRTLKAPNSRYCRLSDMEARKKSDPSPTLDNQGSSSISEGDCRDSGNCSFGFGTFDAKAQRRKKSCGESYVANVSLKKPTSNANDYERLQNETERKKVSGNDYQRLQNEIDRKKSPKSDYQCLQNEMDRKKSNDRPSNEYQRLQNEMDWNNPTDGYNCLQSEIDWQNSSKNDYECLQVDMNSKNLSNNEYNCLEDDINFTNSSIPPSNGDYQHLQSKMERRKSPNNEYQHLQNEIECKKPGPTVEVKHTEGQNRSLIPPPSRRNEYGRLSEGDGGKGSLRKQFGRGQSIGSNTFNNKSGRDSGGTASSEASTSSLPPTKTRSIPRPKNYRIQF